MISSVFKNVVRTVGFELTKFRPENVHISRMRTLLRYFRIETLLDVGANTGQYYSYARNDLKFSGLIFSFEPFTEAFEILQKKLELDPTAYAFNFGILSNQCTIELNISQNSQSSSFLDLDETQKYHTKVANFVSKEVCQVITIDSFLETHPLVSGNIFLKIDVQGTELEALKGLNHHIDRVKLIQVECSFVPLYNDEPTIIEFVDYFNSIGFVLVSASNAFTNPKMGIAYQADLIFAPADCVNIDD